jgi:hypothetical protein
MNEGAQLLELARNAQRLFAARKAPPAQLPAIELHLEGR